MVIDRRWWLAGGAAAFGVVAVSLRRPTEAASAAEPGASAYPLSLTDSQWRARLTPGQYAVLRQASTEIPFTSPLLNEHRAGLFSCAGCGQDCFSSKTKFDSGTGWPSFWTALPKAVATSRDGSLGMDRTEVHCSRCGGHLGHVFDDGPPPTGLRYCMNGQALSFRPAAV
jgi:peptide-methionine (R)-S-oxide reductase